MKISIPFEVLAGASTRLRDTSQSLRERGEPAQVRGGQQPSAAAGINRATLAWVQHFSSRAGDIDRIAEAIEGTRSDFVELEARHVQILDDLEREARGR